MVKYLGEYRSIHYKEGGEEEVIHNIILEYGQRDLDEYLADNYPPVLSNEIIAFWQDLFKVADTLKGLHQLEFEGEDKIITIFKG